MKTVIGVHFWERQARLSVCDADSVNIAALNLPAEIKLLNIVANDFSIMKAFEVIDTFVNERMNVSDYALVICISDDTGLQEIQRLYRCAEEFGVELITTVTETMAMAYFSYVEYGIEGPVMMAFASPAKLAVADYFLEGGSVEKMDTFIAGRWNGTSFNKTEFLTPGSKRFFDVTESELVICSGTMDRCLAFDQALKNYVATSNTFLNNKMEFKMIDPQCIIEGTGFICGKLEGREAFMGLTAVDTLSAYELFISINGVTWPILDMDRIIPLKESIELEKYPETEKPFDDIRIYERRGMTLTEVSRMNVPKEKTSPFYRKPCKLTVYADENRNLEFTVSSILVDEDLVLKVYDYMKTGEEEEVKELKVEDFIAKVLPVIDDLEYAFKYAKDEDNPYTQGIRKTYEKAIQILEANDVTVISGEGEPFDYNTQTAVAHVMDDDLPDNTVKQVMQAGYKYKGKVLRTASVIVAN